jgi:hypothetical protein
MRNTPSLVMLGEGSGAIYHHITVRNSEVRNQHGQGSACITTSGNVKAHHDILLEGLKVHHCGLDMTVFQPGGHCLYIGGNHFTVQDSEFSNCATMGIQLYSEPSDIILRRLHIHHVGAAGILSYDRTVQIDDVEIDHFGQDPAHYGADTAGIKQLLNGTSFIRRNKVSAGGVGIWTALNGTATVVDNIISETKTAIKNEGTSNIFGNNACEPASEYCTTSVPPIPPTPPGGGTVPEGTYTCTDGEHSFTLTLSGEVRAQIQK